MYAEKIEKLENEIQEIKKYIKADKKEIKKREKILSMVVDNDIVSEKLIVIKVVGVINE